MTRFMTIPRSGMPPTVPWRSGRAPAPGPHGTSLTVSCRPGCLPASAVTPNKQSGNSSTAGCGRERGADTCSTTGPTGTHRRRQSKAKRTANARRQALFRDPVLKQAVRERDQDTCRYCGIVVRWGSGRSPASGTYDHIDPAGENTYDNLVVSCLSLQFPQGRPHAVPGRDEGTGPPQAG